MDTSKYIYQDGKKFRLTLVDELNNEDKDLDSVYKHHDDDCLNQDTMLELGIKKCPICDVLTQKVGENDDMVVLSF